MTDKRVILHSDMNSFYASVEMMLDPSLKGKAVAVCGATEERHGIVLAKSDLAKKAGVKTGMLLLKPSIFWMTATISWCLWSTPEIIPSRMTDCIEYALASIKKNRG